MFFYNVMVVFEDIVVGREIYKLVDEEVIFMIEDCFLGFGFLEGFCGFF